MRSMLRLQAIPWSPPRRSNSIGMVFGTCRPGTCLHNNEADNSLSVYTTTFRRRFDPSAYRLENFWWHVWGSDKRNLSGPALARLFEELSNGPTYAPLWSPVEHGQHPKVGVSCSIPRRALADWPRDAWLKSTQPRACYQTSRR